MQKTIKITRLVAIVNERNHCSTCPPATRRGWNSLLEEVLSETDTYHGFGYLTADEVPKGQEPGVRQASPVSFPDESRRYYNRPF